MSRVSLFVFLVGCGGGPLSGTWLYSDSAIATDSCGALDDEDLPVGDFYVYNEGDGTLVIDPNDGSDVFDCTLDKDTFSCPDRIEEELTQGQTTVTAVIGVTGTFDGREAASGSQNGTITCDGPGCALAEEQTGQTFPCTAEVTFSAEWTSPTLP